MNTRDRDLLTADYQAGSIGLIKPSAFGDVVQTLPLLPVLRARFPSARIAWVVHRGLTPLLEGHPHLDRIIPFDRQGGITSWRRLVRDLRQECFDLTLDLQGLLRTGLMNWITRAPLRVGLETAREGSALACHYLLKDTGREVPAHARYWRVAEWLGMGDAPKQTIIQLSDTDRDIIDLRLRKLPRPLLAVHPGARWLTKRWPVEQFAHIAGQFTARYGGTVLLVGSPDECSLTDAVEYGVKQQVPRASVANLCGQTSLKQLAGLLQSADVLLSNDSGPMHLAAGMGTPVVGLFTCTSAYRSGPPDDRHWLVSTKVPCAASYCKTCPQKGDAHLACLRELSPQRVWAALVQAMEHTGAAARRAA